jgi:methionyl-tRNA formyltransferase
LPKYRGASPLQSTLLSNDQELGVCIIKMDKEMDHGPIAAVEYLTPYEGKLSNWPMRFSEYEKVTAEIGAELLNAILPSIFAGTHEYTVQDHSKATYTAKISKEDGHVTELSHLQFETYKNQQHIPILQKIETYLRFCALEEWPGLYFFITKDERDFRIKISDMVWHTETTFAEITKVIPEGKKEMSWKDFLNFIS